MKIKANKQRKDNEFEKPALPLEKMANADVVVGKSIITVSGSEIIPLCSVTVVNLGGGGEYGDVKTYRESDGFKLAGGNGSVVTVKPKGFIVDDGKGCKLLKVEDGAIDTLIEKTGELVRTLSDNA